MTAWRPASGAVVALAAAVAGCGSGAEKTASAPTASRPASTAGQRTAYERAVVRALRGAAGAAGVARQADGQAPAEANAGVFDRVRGLYEGAYLGARPVRPPADVADVHIRVVASLRGLADDARRARDALRGKDPEGLKAALADLRAEGLRLQAQASELRARGY